MKDTMPVCSRNRRRFLMGVLATGGVSALVASRAETLLPEPPPRRSSEDDGAAHGYRVTPHIRDYYQSLR